MAVRVELYFWYVNRKLARGKIKDGINLTEIQEPSGLVCMHVNYIYISFSRQKGTTVLNVLYILLHHSAVVYIKRLCYIP